MAKKRGERITFEERSVEALLPYTNNTKLHPDEQVEEIAASIQTYGFNDPVAIDESGVIVEGHGRVMAAQKLGIAKVPVIVLHEMTPEQIDAYRLVHNRLQERSGHDKDRLRLELKRLASLEFAPSLALDKVGFSVDEITRALKADLKLPDLGGVKPSSTVEGGGGDGDGEPAAGEPGVRGPSLEPGEPPKGDDRTRGHTKDERRFPLSVLLNKDELDRWGQIKAENGWKNDSEAFREIMAGLEESDDGGGG